jgi:prolyl oligopeptidase
VDVVDILHDVRVPDPYRWLEDGDAPDVQAWMREEDTLARVELVRLSRRTEIAARLKELSRRDDPQLPVRIGKRLFYARRAAERERAVVYYRNDGEPTEHVLLDPDSWAADKSASLGSWSVSWDATKVAYDVRLHNRDAGTLHVMDVATGRISGVDVIDGVEEPYAQWTPKADGFYYHKTPQDPALHPKRHELEDIRFHRLGADPAHDVVIRPPSEGQILP